MATAGIDDVATGTINDNDSPPTLSIYDSVSVTEGNTALFIASLSAASSFAVSFDWETQTGTAGILDFTQVGTSAASFAVGVQMVTLAVAINNDLNFLEGSESFSVSIGNPSGAVMGNSVANATILNVEICDSGSLATTCFISSSKSLTDPVSISGNHLVIAPGGVIVTDALEAVTINMGGSVTIEGGGRIEGNAVIAANDFYLSSGATISAASKGEAGGSIFSTGSGAGGGQGTPSNGTFGGAGGGHGGAGGDGVGSRTGGSSYGSVTTPVSFGSGGGGSNADPGGGEVAERFKSPPLQLQRLSMG